MINSIKPRAFIRAPILADSRQFSPANFAANIEAMLLPRIAIAIIKNVIPHKVGVFTTGLFHSHVARLRINSEANSKSPLKWTKKGF